MIQALDIVIATHGKTRRSGGTSSRHQIPFTETVPVKIYSESQACAGRIMPAILKMTGIDKALAGLPPGDRPPDTHGA
jgi:hypothetical protein